MITKLTEEQFHNLPPMSLHCPCDKCGKQYDYGRLMRDINDYSLEDGEIISQPLHTALYLCGACHWTMTCDYSHMEGEQQHQIVQMMNNEARWLQKISHLSIPELAAKVGVSRQAYYKWLRGKPITGEHKARLKSFIVTYMEE